MSTNESRRRVGEAATARQNECVEVARDLPGIIAIRDSKDPAPTLAFGPGAMARIRRHGQGRRHHEVGSR